MNADFPTLVGACAAICSVASFAPQAWKVIKSRETTGLSGPTYVLTIAGFALWTAYGALLGQWPVIIPNVLCGVLAAFILMMILLPRKKREEVARTLASENSKDQSGT